MAISRIATQTGTKTTTSGTTATVALNSTAGDMVVVCIAQSSNTITVSSVTDGGGNVYHQVGRITGSTTVSMDVWKTDLVNAAASGTITITVSGTGARIAACASSYRGVAFAGNPASSNNLATSPITSGSVTLKETNGWIVMGGGTAANNAFTAQNGQLRGQIGTTNLRVCMIDSNDGASPTTCSATMTASQWAAVWFEIRPLEATADTLAMSDAESNVLCHCKSFLEVMELVDADSTGLLTGKQDIDYNKFAHWQEDFRMFITQTGNPTIQRLGFSDGNQRTKISSVDAGNPGVSISVTDTLVWQDGSPVLTYQYGVQIICPHLGDNWLDSATLLLAIALTLSDNLNNWADALGIGYGNIVSDQLTMSDSLGAGYGSLTSDQMVIVDSLGAGYGALLSDNLNNWLDAITGFGYGMQFFDNRQMGPDGIAIGYGNIVVDQMTMSDFVGAGYGNATSDQLVIVDSIGAGYGALLSDNLNNWLDAFQFSAGSNVLTLTLSDSLNSWADVMFAGYGNATSDQMIITDSLGAGYGAVLSDSLNNWSDFVALIFGVLITLSDTMNNWSDALFIGYGNSISDQLTMSDSLGAGYGAATSDQMIIVDSLGAGYGGLISDNLNSWTDAESNVLGFAISLSDSLNSWADTLAAGYGNAISDQLVMSDSLAAGYGNATSDQMVIVDSLGAGYGALLSDNLNNWLDAFADQLIGAQLQLTLSDSLNFWADFVQAGYGAATSDQMILADSLGAGYGGSLSDSLNSWNDAESNQLGFAITLSDNLNNWLDLLRAGYGNALSDQLVIVDSLGAGYGALLSDSLNFWQDAFNEILFGAQISIAFSDDLNNWADFLRVGYGAATSDQMVIADSMSTGYGALLSDSLNSWVDLENNVLGFVITLTDTDSTWADFLRAGYGVLFSDQLVLTDSTSAGYGFLLSDSLNFWQDVLTLNLGSNQLTLSLSDNLNLWADFVAAGYGAATSDQMVLTDSLGAGYGFVLSDSLTTWLDQVVAAVGYLVSITDTMNFWLDVIGAGYGLALTDQDASYTDTIGAGYGMITADQFQGMVDAVGIGYGLVISDTLMFWIDFLATSGLVGPIDVTVSDNLNYWADALELMFATNTGPIKIKALQAYNKVVLSTIDVHGKIRLRDVEVVPSLGVQPTPILVMVSDDDANNWSDSFGATLISQLFIPLADDGSGAWADGYSTFLGTVQLSLTDNMAGWADFVQLDSSHFGLNLGDNMGAGWSDFMPSFTEDYSIAIGDTVGPWLDVVALA